MRSAISTEGYFIMEKLDYVPEFAEPVQPTEAEKRKILEEVYGEYEITEFLPTVYYPANDSSGIPYLPQEETDMMIGRRVIVREEMFRTWDNYRYPNSTYGPPYGRDKEGYWIKEAEVTEPEYQIRNVPRDEIYGLRDDMLSNDMIREVYTEIDVYPGYRMNESWHDAEVLPQLFLLGDGRIIMYGMGEYFLLKKS